MHTSTLLSRLSLLLAAALVLVAVSPSRPAIAGEFRAGAAAVDITPKNGTPLAGYYSYRASTGVIDPLYAKAIVVEQDGERAALVVLDLVTTNRKVVLEARKLISEGCGIPADRVMISATHTHTGPQLPRGNLMDDITKANAPAARDYAEALPGLIAKSVIDASAKLTPAKASAATGKAEGISFNRRVIGADGRLIWQPARINPAVERPAGPIDPDLGLLVFDGVGPRPAPLAAYVNFAMHPTSIGGGTRISADFPGALCNILTERKGRDMVTVFANGCCGNINNTNYMPGSNQLRGPLETKRLGTALADAAVATWDQLKPLSTHAPRGRSTLVTLPRRKYSDEAVAKARDVVRRMATEKLGTVVMAEAVSTIDATEKKDQPLEVEVQVVAFSDELAVVALPGEIFVELGLAIKKASPYKQTFIAELANGSMGYVPNREAYAQGNYEVVSARAEAGSGEMLVDAALKLLNESRAKQVPR